MVQNTLSSHHNCIFEPLWDFMILTLWGFVRLYETFQNALTWKANDRRIGNQIQDCLDYTYQLALKKGQRMINLTEVWLLICKSKIPKCDEFYCIFIATFLESSRKKSKSGMDCGTLRVTRLLDLIVPGYRSVYRGILKYKCVKVQEQKNWKFESLPLKAISEFFLIFRTFSLYYFLILISLIILLMHFVFKSIEFFFKNEILGQMMSNETGNCTIKDKPSMLIHLLLKFVILSYRITSTILR